MGVFARDLHRDNLSADQVAAYWSAMLNAAYSVLEASRGEAELLLKNQSQQKPSYDSVFAKWLQTLAPSDAEVFDVLRHVRGVEVHSTNSSTTFVPKLEEQQQRRQVPDDPTYRAIYASYIAMGMLTHEVTVGTLTYGFTVNAAHRDPKVKALLTRFNQGGARALLGAASDYVRLFADMVASLVTAYQ